MPAAPKALGAPKAGAAAPNADEDEGLPNADPPPPKALVGVVLLPPKADVEPNAGLPGVLVLPNADVVLAPPDGDDPNALAWPKALL